MMKKLILLFLVSTLPVYSYASVVIENTRIIYTEGREGKTVKITNNEPASYIIQLWSDDGNANSQPTDANAPFVILPPGFKISPHSVQTVKLLYTGKALPTDRESVFYFNMVQVPPVKQNQNALALILKNRLKIFYRPLGLSAPSASVQESALTFTSANNAISVKNKSKYFVSMAHGELICPGGRSRLEAEMFAPESTTKWTARVSAKTGCNINYTYINDFGGHITIKARVM